MSNIIVVHFIDFLKRKYHSDKTLKLETLESYSNFSVFGSYFDSHFLILEKNDDIQRYEKYIIVTEKINNINPIVVKKH